MTERYLLNDSILFTPEDNSLQVISNGGPTVHLNTPASRCLLLLIRNHPESVAQKDFFNFVWGGQGNQMPTNALYQNISLLRRALSTTSETLNNAVQTIPRVGFKLNPDISLKTLNKEDSKVLLSKPHTTLTHSLIINIHLFRKVINISILAGIIIVWLTFLPSILITHDSHNDDYFNSFKKSFSTSECNVYLPRNYSDDDNHFVRNIIDKINPACESYKNIYYNERSDRERISILQCKPQPDEKNECVTKIYWNEKP